MFCPNLSLMHTVTKVLEEALLRGTQDNWMIVNDGAFSPAIVMGISGWVGLSFH